MNKFDYNRQQRRENVQKQFLSNYYHQKYDSLMAQISEKSSEKPKPAHYKVNLYPASPKVNHSNTQRINFKNVMKKKTPQKHDYLQRSFKPIFESKNQEQQRHASAESIKASNKFKKLQDSIIHELYNPSPSKMEEGKYESIQIQEKWNIQLHKQKNLNSQSSPFSNIEITHQEELIEDELNQNDELFPSKPEPFHREHTKVIRFAMEQQFKKRENRLSTPKKSASKILSHQKQKSFQIDLSIKKIKDINEVSESSGNQQKNLSKHSSRRIARPDIYDKTQKSQNLSDNVLIGQKRQNFSYEGSNQQKVYQFKQEKDLKNNISEDKKPELQFVAPTSNYYKNTQDLVEQSFRYQQNIGLSEKVSSRRQSMDNIIINENSLRRDSSTKSIDGKGKTKRDSSNRQMSVVSKYSMTSDEGYQIKYDLQRQLNENELGPYQSALYALLQLMEDFPKIWPIFVTCRKMLEDRSIYEERRKSQQLKIAEQKQKIEKLKKKSLVKLPKREQETIRKNKQQILQLIRQIQSKLE